MKNTVLIVVMLGICLVQARAQAEPESIEKLTTLGLKAEANLSNFILSDNANITSKMNVGATFGGLLNLNIAKYFAVQGDLLYHYKSSNFEFDRVNHPFQYVGMEIAIYAVLQRKIGDWQRIYVGLGPYSEFGFSANLKVNGTNIDLYEKDGATQLSSMVDFNSGFGLMAGYEFRCGIQINAAFKISNTNVLDANSVAFALNPQAVSVGVGYRFGKN